MSGLIRYCAIPTRFARSPEWPKLRRKIQEIVRSWGDVPVIPFDVGPYDDFEGNPKIGRARTLPLMIHLKNGCDADALFGISEGTMIETKDTLDNIDASGKDRDIRIHLDLDTEWEKFYAKFRPKYGDVLARRRGAHWLIDLVGPRAVGKTFWSDYLLGRFRGKLKRVKNTTTRIPRNREDHASYQFIGVAEFKQGIREHQFLEWDEYQGNYYGSSRDEIRRVLRTSHGIFAITPKGAIELDKYRHEINLATILLTPASQSVLLQNFDRRGIVDPGKRSELLADAENFALPTQIVHQKVTITGSAEEDEKRILKIVEPLISK